MLATANVAFLSALIGLFAARALITMHVITPSFETNSTANLLVAGTLHPLRHSTALMEATAGTV